jgi:hypothetical protein
MFFKESVYLKLGWFDPFEHSSNFKGQTTQRVHKPNFEWYKLSAHMSNQTAQNTQITQ